MNKYIKQNLNKIIGIFILIQPILDLLTGLCVNVFNTNITLGVIIRTLFLAFIMYTTVIIYKKKDSFYTYLALIIYSILYLIGIIIYKDNVLFIELQSLVKVLYFPTILISLYDLKDKIKISKMTLFTTLFLYLILILIPNILGVGFQSYQIAKTGNLGFFNSANEISGIISILTPIMFIVLKDLKNILLRIFLIIMYLVVILTIGTKTPLITLLITIALSYLYYMLRCIKKKTFKPIIYSTLIIIAGVGSLLLVMPKTNFYKNIKVHLDYLEIDNVLDIFEEKELIDHFIFSQRLTFLVNKADNYSESAPYEKLFGIGYTNNSKITKLIEMDYFDILYSHGIIGFIAIFTIYALILYYLIKERQKMNYEKYMFKLSVSLILILSLFTGHIITGPSVSLIAIILILSITKREKKDLLFSTVDFEIGGIETSLINLLNQFDYDKYNVTVILEEKKGLLLQRVNNNAKIEELKVSNNKNIIIRKTINLTRKIFYSILNYHNYDFGCCYATYSLSSNKIARISSKNTAIYVHSNYKYIYKEKEEFQKFFDDRKITEFKKIIFVSNEAKESFIEIYKSLKRKCEVFSNFIDVNMVVEKSAEKISVRKPKDKKLLVFVGRLDDQSKKLSRAINLIKEIDDLALWIIGDGPDKKMYQNLVKEYHLEKSITFFGGTENPYPYMKQADYIILTSDYEGFPITYLEAITLNNEIITTIDVSDSQLNIGKDFAYIVSKDEKKMVSEVKRILKAKGKMKKIDFEKLQKDKFKRLEKIFNEVI